MTIVSFVFSYLSFVEISKIGLEKGGGGVVLEHASVYSGWLVHWTIGSKATFV